jgi:hypothetical protein
MRNTHAILGRWLAAVSVLFLLALAGCGAAKANTVPTLSVEDIFTSAVQTITAQQATQLALTPPTDTPAAPSPFPTLPPSSPLPVGTISFASPTVSTDSSSACDNAAYVADVSIPDGTKMDPGQSFKKTWTLHNNGTCTWDNHYKLSFLSGDQMGGSDAFVVVPVPPGQEMNVSVNLTSPSSYGDYKGVWQMKNGQDQSFGSQITVVIKVRNPAVPDTPTP